MTNNSTAMSANSSVLTFDILTGLKKVHEQYYTENHNDLYDYLYEELGNIGKDVQKAYKSSHTKPVGHNGIGNNSHSHSKYTHTQHRSDNGSRTKPENSPFNNQKSHSTQQQHNNQARNNDWRSASHTAGPVGLSSLINGANKFKLSINRELNKLSPVNKDVIFQSIIGVFGDWIIEQINTDTEWAQIYEKYTEHLNEFWYDMIRNMLNQQNMAVTYFAFLNQCCIFKSEQMMVYLKEKSPVVASKVPATAGAVSGGNNQLDFAIIRSNRDELIDEILKYLKSQDYFSKGNSRLNELLRLNLDKNIENTFSTLGSFIRNTIDVAGSNNGKKRRQRTDNTLYDVLLVAFYDNFRNLNELVAWDPVVIEDVERRVYLTISFLEDNRTFIHNLDMDFYRDIECELDSLKKCTNIPNTIKYKLLNCIDNFITTRHAK